MAENLSPTLKNSSLVFGLFLAAFFGGGVIVWLSPKAILSTFGALIAVFLLLFGMRNESIPFYFLVGSLCIQSVFRSEVIPTTYLVIPGVLLAVSFALSLLSGRAAFIWDKKTVLLGLSLCIWATLSAVNAGNGSTSRPYWLVFGLFFLAQNLFQERNRFLAVAWILVISLSVTGAWVLFERVLLYIRSGDSISPAQLHLAPLEAGDKNIVGMQLTLALPFAFYLWNKYQAASPRTLLAISLILLSLGTMALVSIGATLGWVAAFLLSMLLFENKVQRVRYLLIGVILLTAAGLSPFGSRLLDRLNSQRINFLEGDPATWGTDRGMLWSAAVKTVANSPWFGEGPGNLAAVTEAAVPFIRYDYLKYILQTGKMIVPHNLFLSVAVEIGSVGLFGFIILILLCLLPLLKMALQKVEPSSSPGLGSIEKPVCISLVVLLLQGQGLGVHLDKYLWFLLGMGAACANDQPDDEDL